jgi:hypothetical protein
MAYLRDDRATASRLLATLAALPAAPSGPRLRLLDALADDGTGRAVATSAGLWVPDDAERKAPALQGRSATLLDAPVGRSALVTWALWLGWDGALDAACRQLCNAPDSEYALAESLRVLAGTEACRALFDLLRSSEPPAGPADGTYEYPLGALRALVAPFGADVAPLVSSALSASSVPARVAACAAAGATRADVPGGRPGAADGEAAGPALWGDDHHPLPEDSLRANLTHDHPAVRTAARDTCARLSLEDTPSRQTT